MLSRSPSGSPHTLALRPLRVHHTEEVDEEELRLASGRIAETGESDMSVTSVTSPACRSPPGDALEASSSEEEEAASVSAPTVSGEPGDCFSDRGSVEMAGGIRPVLDIRPMAGQGSAAGSTAAAADDASGCMRVSAPTALAPVLVEPLLVLWFGLLHEAASPSKRSPRPRRKT